MQINIENPVEALLILEALEDGLGIIGEYTNQSMLDTRELLSEIIDQLAENNDTYNSDRAHNRANMPSNLQIHVWCEFHDQWEDKE